MTAEQREASRLYGKVAWRIIPFLVLCYAIALIDRFNIGYAKLQFLEDLGLNDQVFGLAAGAFSVGYVALEVPSNYLLSRIGLRKTLVRIMVLWGSVTMLLAFARGANDLYVLRFLLGAAEGGFFPGILYYLTLWFPDRLRARATSLFVIALPIAGITAGPLSGWIMDNANGVAGLRGWQWLFLIEGLPAVLLGVIAYRRLSDGPADAAWLSGAERELLLSELRVEGESGPERPHRFRDAFRNRHVYILAAIYFAYFCSLNTILLWTPTVLKAIGVPTATRIGELHGLISFAATLAMLIVGYSSDRFGERRWHIAVSGFIASGCLLALAVSAPSQNVSIGLLAGATAGIFGILALFWTIPSAALQGPAAAGALAFIGSVGSFGGAVSPAVIGWSVVKTGSIHSGFAGVALLLAAGMITLLLSIPSSRQRSSKRTALLPETETAA